MWWFKEVKVSSLLLIVAAFYLTEHGIDARGSRGGSRGGGRYTSSRSSYRSGSSYRSSRSGLARYGKYAAAAAAGAAIYGMASYRSRYYGTRYYRQDPNICSNIERYATFDNGTVSKTLKLNYFVCPYETSDAPDAYYCCGPEDKQFCCTYWKSSEKTGAIIGILIAFIVVVIVAIYAFRRCRQSREQPPPQQAVYQANKYETPVLLNQNQAAPSYYPPAGGSAYPPQGPSPYPPPAPYGAAPYPTAPPNTTPYPLAPQAAAPYPPQPAPGIGFEGTAPPSYDAAAGYPTK